MQQRTTSELKIKAWFDPPIYAEQEFKTFNELHDFFKGVRSELEGVDCTLFYEYENLLFSFNFFNKNWVAYEYI